MQTQIHSPNLSDYIVQLNLTANCLECSLDFNGFVWFSVIEQNNLTFELIDLAKLANIIKLNLHETIKYYSIWLELSKCIQTNSKILILNIQYSNEFIEWEEKIIFKQLNSMENSLRNNFNLIIKNQQRQIDQLTKLIEQMQNKIIELEETNQSNQYLMINQTHDSCISILENNIDVGASSQKIIYVPKYIDCLVIEIFSNQTNDHLANQYISLSMWLKLFMKKNLCLCATCGIGNQIPVNFDIFPPIYFYGNTDEIFSFVKIKKIIVKCEGNQYNNSVRLSIGKFIKEKIIGTNHNITIEFDGQSKQILEGYF